MRKGINASSVLRTKFTVTFDRRPLSAPAHIEFELSFDIYTNQSAQTRTVCYGVMKSLVTGATRDLFGVAKLHPEHQEEFDVHVGIRQSLSKALDVLRDSDGRALDRCYRKQFWCVFEKELEECLPKNGFDFIAGWCDWDFAKKHVFFNKEEGAYILTTIERS